MRQPKRIISIFHFIRNEKTKMKLFSIFFLSALILISCNHNVNNKHADKSPFFIDVNSYDFTDTTVSLFTERVNKDIIQLKCNTNLPLNTRLTIKKGLMINSTSDRAEKDQVTDTITIGGPEFTISFRPRFVCGYISFAVLPDLQSNDIKAAFPGRDKDYYDMLFFSSYQVTYQNSSKDNNCYAIPDVPIKLVITKER